MTKTPSYQKKAYDDWLKRKKEEGLVRKSYWATLVEHGKIGELLAKRKAETKD